MKLIRKYIIFLSVFCCSRVSFGMELFIENPFDKKQEDEIQLTLDLFVTQENGFFAESGKKRDCVFDKGQNDLAFESPANVITHALPKRQLKKKKRKRYVDVFNKNENNEYLCPYNCPYDYAHKRLYDVVGHIKRRHDKDFDLQIFDPDEVDLDVWIPRKEKRYADVFKENEDGEFECPYNCLDEYAHKEGRMVVQHIKRRHGLDFNLQTFDAAKADLDAWTLRKKNSGGKKKYADVFEKNKDREFECLYNCPDEYAHKKGKMVVQHIKARHNKNFDLHTFDPDEVDLDAWIPRKKAGRKKRYEDVFKKNKKGKFECPYNCPDEYANKKGNFVVRHIKVRHDLDFDLYKFDHQKVDLNAWIPRKKTGLKRKCKTDDTIKRYADVLEKNERGEFECPYNCSDDYTHKRGDLVGQHIRVRHDKGFNLQTFDPDEADLDAWIPRKTGWQRKRKDSIEKDGDKAAVNRKKKKRKLKI